MRKTILNIALLCCLSSIVFGQIASYNFDSNLLDEVGNHHAQYLEQGQPSENTPDFNAGDSGMNIFLDITEGLLFPSTLNDNFDVESSIEFSFDFRMEDIGEKEGFMYAITNQNGSNSLGWSLLTIHDIFTSIPNYELFFAYSDGGAEMGVPDHPGHNSTLLGNFIEGEWVNIRLILDFEKNNWTVIVNGNYTSAFFNNEYDIDLIRESITNNDLFLAWTQTQAQDVVFNPNGWANAASFDQLEIYSPKKPGDASVFSSALQNMIDHVNGSKVLSEDELKNNLAAIQLNYDGSFDASKDKIYEYTSAYEMRYDPLFKDLQYFIPADLPAESQVLLFLQQDIFDNQFINGNIDNLEGVKFEAADAFPGKVAASAPRLNDQVLEIYGTYSSIQGARVAADLRDAKRPTGFYLAPGDIANISIPPALINSGLKVMVGAHDSDHSNVDWKNRFVRISKTYALDTEVTPIANPFGGGIYIKVPEGSDLGWFEIEIDGAVKSPYFSAREGRQTSPSVWQTELSSMHVPWADIEGDKFMTTLPLDVVADIDDPTLLMSHWSKIMDGYRYVGGRPYFRARAEYFLLDSRLPGGGGYGTGYPQVVGIGDLNLYPTMVLTPEFYKTDFLITLHEYGHLAAHPTLQRETESIVHLNASYIYDEYFGLPIDSSFKYSAFEHLTMDQTAMDWMIAFNFRNNNEMSCDPTMEELVCDEVRYQHRGHAKYVQLAMLFGWESVYEMNKVFYDRWTAEFDNLKLASSDEIIEFSSNGAGVNMAPLMHFWGLQPSDELAAKLASMPRSDEILTSLIHYKSLIPADMDAFQSWYDILRPKKGQPHFNRYDRSLAEFDTENYAADMRAQIDFLIATYFPPLSSESAVITFNLPNQIGETIVDTISSTINLTVAHGSDITNLIATFSISRNATATVNGVLQESGVTVNDFTNPLVYHLISEDESSVTEYTVTVLVDAPPASTHANVMTFNLPNQVGETIVDTINNTIYLNVTNGTDLTNLVATFSISMNATAKLDDVTQESGVTANDFTNPLVYLVVAEDTSFVKEWTVTVVEEMPSSVLDLEENKVLVHPNPVKDELYIDLNMIKGSEIVLEIFDLFGRKVENYKVNVSASTLLNVSDYLPGIYLGVIHLDNKDLIFKFVKI